MNTRELTVISDGDVRHQGRLQLSHQCFVALLLKGASHAFVMVFSCNISLDMQSAAPSSTNSFRRAFLVLDLLLQRLIVQCRLASTR